MSTYIPHLDDSDTMTDIHSRMTGLIERMIPMNRNDSNWLCDGVIPFQDEAYVCGRKRGLQEGTAELVDSLNEILNLCAIGDVDEDTEAYGWGEAIKRAHAAVLKATQAAA